MIDKATVIGTGMWGTTLAIHLARKGIDVALWARTAAEAGQLRKKGENTKLLPGIRFPEQLTVTGSLTEAFSGSSIALVVVPAQTMRDNIRAIRDHLPPDIILVSAAKGIETATQARMSQVIREELTPDSKLPICALSGPNLAREVAAGHPTTTVVASSDPKVASIVQQALITPLFRVYTNDDVIGVELGGALKNVIALGAGMGDGLEVGDNAKAAFITRGLAEIARLGTAMGANPLTFAGLAGLGDLIATCASRQSRNHYVGEELARGRSLDAIRSSMVSVAEGVPTTAAARQLARRYNVEMPITELMYQVLFCAKPPRDAIMELMTREPKGEL